LQNRRQKLAEIDNWLQQRVLPCRASRDRT
jgi:hypothetical protein